MNEVMIMDIEASCALFFYLSECLTKTGQKGEIDKVLGRVKNYIKDKRFTYCLLSQRAFDLLRENEIGRAIEVMRSVPEVPIESLLEFETGTNSLRLFVDLRWQEIPRELNIQILDAILETDENKLQKAVAFLQKAQILYYHRDEDSAFEVAKNAIHLLEKFKPKNKGEIKHLHVILASAYEQIAYIKGDASIGADAIREYELALENEGEKEAVAYINGCIARICGVTQDFERAEVYFEKAWQLDHNTNTLLGLAHSKILLEKIAEARNLVDSINEEALIPEQTIEYLDVLGHIAIREKNTELVNEVEEKLSHLDIQLPLENDVIDNIIRSLHDMQAPPAPSQPFLYKARQVINKYLILHPTIFGFGINLNSLIDPDRRQNKPE